MEVVIEGNDSHFAVPRFTFPCQKMYICRMFWRGESVALRSLESVFFPYDVVGSEGKVESE